MIENNRKMMFIGKEIRLQMIIKRDKKNNTFTNNYINTALMYLA
jgi:hypothetical protein